MDMTLAQVGGAALIFLLCPIVGALPIIDVVARLWLGKRLARLGTGNISVSAAFYHGGTGLGLMAVASEALKGIAAVLLARYFFPAGSAWEVLALICLVMGRYAGGRGAGTTNVVWGYVVHDWQVAALTLLIGGGSFTVLRQRRTGRLFVLVLLPLLTLALHPHDQGLVMMAALLSILIAWIYQKIPDDLDLPVDNAQSGSRSMFQFFRGDRAVMTLNQRLEARKVGAKAATLAQLNYWGYAVPTGWILCPGDDPAPILATVPVSTEQPVVVRSSAVGEDGATTSAAGQYLSILNVTDRDQLETAIRRCLNSYNRASASQYRRDRGLADEAMAVLVQRQVAGAFSGVAFSRDPIAQQGSDIIIEALPGLATQVVSGQVNPERYRVQLQPADLPVVECRDPKAALQIPDGVAIAIDGEGDVPRWLIEQVAYMVRQLEGRFHGIPQDMEWSYDGQVLWILQCRPITNLTPIWTRKIAAEVIPGIIRPLTWSINRPLTCGVWGEIFEIVLGMRSQDLDFNETATLHFGHAYFNATLLGEIFLRMGLPADSLEFLTRGAKFSKPPIFSTLRNVPGLWRLLQQEWTLIKDFQHDNAQSFQPLLATLQAQSLEKASDTELLQTIEQILEVLQRATYYSILGPLSLACRTAILKVPVTDLSSDRTPEIKASRELRELAAATLQALPDLDLSPVEEESHEPESVAASVFSQLEATATAQPILQRFEQFLEAYGYLSEVGTDISISTWQEEPRLVQNLFVQMLRNVQQQGAEPAPDNGKAKTASAWKTRQAQKRLDLKGEITEVYSRLLAHLRWVFVALGDRWQNRGDLAASADLFFLTLSEIRERVQNPSQETMLKLQTRIQQRREQFSQYQKLQAPQLVYGAQPPDPSEMTLALEWQVNQVQGLAASPGLVEGPIQVLTQLEDGYSIPAGSILVVPYTDSAWSPVLAQAAGLIAEVGGQLSHGAIVAREYGIPAVMDIPQATQLFKTGQIVRLNGHQGLIEILP